MKKNAKRSSDSALAKKNNKTTTLRIEPLESREMLSATGWETGGNETVAFVATEAEIDELIDLSAADVASDVQNGANSTVAANQPDDASVYSLATLQANSENAVGVIDTRWHITEITNIQVELRQEEPTNALSSALLVYGDVHIRRSEEDVETKEIVVEQDVKTRVSGRCLRTLRHLRRRRI